ncbi:MAG: glycosyltransferase [Chlorobiales bacterium]|nr:glycosyltransferase [Chlorobiales bacterium]
MNFTQIIPFIEEPHSILLTCFSLFCLFGWAVLLLRISLVARDMQELPAAESSGKHPRVSIIVPARNEAVKIKPALESLLAQDYPNLEIIVIDDRSMDETPSIVSEFLQKSMILKFVRITSLPEGWLGKNYANQKGFEASTGEYLLFTDADVVFEKDAVSKAVSYALSSGARHIVAYGKMMTEGVFEYAFIALFGLLFTWKFDPRGAIDPKNKKAYVGVGAFNFIERSLYETIGTHITLRAEVADDVMLGYHVKQQGYGTYVVQGKNLLSVRWREGLWDSIRGVERSAFPGIRFSWFWVGTAIFGTFAGLVAPFWLIGFDDLIAKSCAVLSMLIISLCYYIQDRSFPKAVLATVLHPVMSMLFLYALLRSAIKITLDGGVMWRDTFYPIHVLKSKTY